MAKTYNPKKVIFTMLGQPITGYADGTFIVVSRNVDSFTMVKGADGETARAASADKSGTIKVTLLQTSAGNDLLSAALAKDELSNLNTGPAFVKDASGRTLAAGGDAWVQKYADVEMGKEVAAREWTIAVGDLDMFVGGN